MRKIRSYILLFCTLLNMFIGLPNVSAHKTSNAKTKSTTIEYVPDSRIVIDSQKLSKDFTTSTIRTLSFKSCKNQPLYENGMPRAEDIRQTSLGVCYFLAAISAILAVNPQTIVDCLEDQNDGTVIANLYDPYDGSLHKIKVDKSVPNLNDCYSFLSNNSPLWIHLLLKAFVASRLYSSSRSYKALEGGLPSPMLRMLTGKEAYSYNGIELGFMGKKRLLKKISDAIKNKNSIGCLFTPQTKYGKKLLSIYDPNKELVTSHAYSVIGVDKNSVIFRNPWGKDNSTKDGVHIMDINTFFECCSEIEVTTSDPIKKRGFFGKMWEKTHYLLPILLETAAQMGWQFLKMKI